MSTSLYYTAKRDAPISPRERDACRRVAEHSIAEYPLGDMYEPFCVYDPDAPSEKDVIFEGATKLPTHKGTGHFAKVYDYWGDCLQEIINLLPGARWHIHIDDTDVTPYFDDPGPAGSG